MEKRKNGGIIFFLIMCIFIALAAGLFGGYKYYELKVYNNTEEESNQDVIKNDENTNNLQDEITKDGTEEESNQDVIKNDENTNNLQDEITKDGNVTIINNIGKDVVVRDYINYTIDRTGIKNCGGSSEFGKANVRIPMIDSNKKGATELNKLIKNDLELFLDSSYYTNFDIKKGKTALELIASYGYWYVNNSNYLTLKVSSIYKTYCATGSSYNHYYTYDIENDNYLSNDELLKLYNISYEDLKKKIKDNLDIQTDYYNSIVNYLERGEYELYITENGD